MKCGLLGRRLGHSYSPAIHKMLGNESYPLFEKGPEELENFLKNGDFSGINVTIPYKKAVIPYLDELSPRARLLGAVNTVVRLPGGSLMGHNTDYFGFETLLARSGLSISGKKALVLGSGGASNTVCAVLQQAGAQVVVISREGENNYKNLDRHRDAALIVNATPVGMFPENGKSPLSLRDFSELEGVLDLIYNPARTALLLEAEERGLVWENGLTMLVAQAKESAEWFSGTPISQEVIPKICLALEKQMENLILIGMPGCGKSTVGRLLAEKMGRKFVDADLAIEEAAGRPIPEIFAQQGEAGFRALETGVLEELGKQSGLVIATGGGCVTRRENYRLLHQNGRIFWLRRSLEALPTGGRPLSQTTPLEEMYEKRRPLYGQFADFSVQNDGSPEEAAEKIRLYWEETP